MQPSSRLPVFPACDNLTCESLFSGKETAAAILTCFTNNIILKTNDHLSLEALTKRFGKTHKAITSMGMTRNSVNTSMVETTAIEPDVLNSLDVGEAIVSILGHEPFWIKLDQNI